MAKCQREAGDPAAARATLDRLIKLVESLKDVPRIEELIQLTGTKQPRTEQHEVGAVVRCELLLVIADERLALGIATWPASLYRRAVAAIQPQNDVLKPMISPGSGAGFTRRAICRSPRRH